MSTITIQKCNKESKILYGDPNDPHHLINEVNKLPDEIFNLVIIKGSLDYEILLLFLLSLRRFCDEETIIQFDYPHDISLLNKLSKDRYKFKSEYLDEYNKSTEPTIITYYYNIESKIFSTKDYLSFGKSFKNIKAKVVIFTDIKTFDDMKEQFKNDDNILIKLLDFKNMYYYQYLDKIKELQQTFKVSNVNVNKDTPLYTILNSNKFCCIEEAIEKNYFNTDKFMWLDFGIKKNIKNFEMINMFIKDVPDKIKQMIITPFNNDMNNRKNHTFNHHYIGAGLFSGNAKNLLKYSKLYKDKFLEIINDGWWQLDEGIMSIVCYENKELFDPYFGDYREHFINYLHPFQDKTGLINKSLFHYTNNKIYYFGYTLLNYIYHLYSYNNDIEKIKYYIYHSLIIQYYSNNKTLDSNFICCIERNKNNSKIVDHINNNMKNLKFYPNKDTVLNLLSKYKSDIKFNPNEYYNVDIRKYPTYVISLKEKKDRRDYIVKEFKSVNYQFEFFDAVKEKKWMGCTLSHYNLIKKNIEKTPFVPFTIFEDDIKFTEEFKQTFTIPKNSDLFYLGFSTGSTDYSYTKEGVNCLQLTEDIVEIFNVHSTHGICYLNRDICKKVLLFIEKSFNKIQHDIAMAYSQRFYNCVATINPVCYQYGVIGGQELPTKDTLHRFIKDEKNYYSSKYSIEFS